MGRAYEYSGRVIVATEEQAQKLIEKWGLDHDSLEQEGRRWRLCWFRDSNELGGGLSAEEAHKEMLGELAEITGCKEEELEGRFETEWWSMERDPDFSCGYIDEEYPEDEVVCSNCGGSNVQMTMWVNPNTNEIRGDFGSFKERDTSWCMDCNDNAEDGHQRLIYKTDYNLEKEKKA